MTLAKLAEIIGAQIVGGDKSVHDTPIIGCAGLDDANPGQISFLVNPKYISQLKTTQATAVIVSKDTQIPPGIIALVTDDAYFSFRNALVALHGWRDHPEITTPSENNPAISQHAVIHPSATLGQNVTVHPFAVICENVTIGDNTIIYPHTFIGANVTIGHDCQIYPSVTIYEHCTLGDRVTLHSGCVIGQDGFGYATHKGAHHKIPQTGNVVIQNDVEMGAGCAIDRATMGSTVIGEGTKFSDLIAIGHGTKIGKHNLYVALTGLAGSVETGDYVVIGGQAGIAGHLKIGNMVQIAATSGVMADIPDNSIVGGTPSVDIKDFLRNHVNTNRLPDLISRIKKLERKLKKLEEQ